MPEFQFVSEYQPSGDQPKAIQDLVHAIQHGRPHTTLLGVTGSGKTYTMGRVIEQIKMPTLVISHNKTLAAQLYSEFKSFFPHNAVSYFVSYYDYYQPEAYIPQKDIYIEKDASINQEIDRLRLQATSSLLSREDVIIVASVSCIYGLGSPENYEAMLLLVRCGDTLERHEFLRRLVNMQYDRNDVAFERGRFRVRGDVLDIFPAYEETGLRVELFGEEVERISEIHPVTGEVLRDLEEATIYPAKHYVLPEGTIARAVDKIRMELEQRLQELNSQNLLLEAQRLEARINYDIEMLLELGYCSGVENYSRHMSGRAPGARPDTLIDYFPDKFLTIVDESHVTIPQIRGMYAGDRSRKETLVAHGFRLPSALDNRPMRFDEWVDAANQVVYASATPGPYELEKSEGEVIELIIRPTGLVDPPIDVRPTRGQVEDLLVEIEKTVAAGERVLITTLTKRLAEDLSQYIIARNMKCQYLHSEIHTVERVEILQNLRKGHFDVLVGVNLLREGLDLPEVSLVAILDADKEGFLRSETALVQTIGRAARNVNAHVILYADKMTGSMERAMNETDRRRQIQIDYNAEHGITPETVKKKLLAGIEAEISSRQTARLSVREETDVYVTREMVKELEGEMLEAARALDFERAAEIRDHLASLDPEWGQDKGLQGSSSWKKTKHTKKKRKT